MIRKNQAFLNKLNILLDLWYIEHQSSSLDMKILFRTVFGGMINKEGTT